MLTSLQYVAKVETAFFPVDIIPWVLTHVEPKQKKSCNAFCRNIKKYAETNGFT